MYFDPAWLLSLTSNYIVAAFACTAALRPRLQPLPTVAICVTAIMGSMFLFHAWTHSGGHGRIVPIIVSLILVLVLFKDPLAIRITALCQAATLAALVDAATLLLGTELGGLPFAVVARDIRWSYPVLPTRMLNLVLVVAAYATWAYAWRHVIRPLSDKRRGLLVVMLSAQALAQAFLLSELASRAAYTPYVISMIAFMLLLGASALVLLFVFLRIFARGAAEDARQATMASQQRIQASFIQNLHAYAGTVSGMKKEVQGTVDTLRDLIQTGNLQALDAFLGKAAQSQSQSSCAYSGSLAVSSLLGAKVRDCQTLGIRLLIRTRMDFAVMSEFDACTVLSNLLDNAIRATRRCEPGNRWITLALSRPSGLLMLVCRNTYNPAQSGQRSPLRHGMGLNIVREVSAKYGGALELTREDGVFTAVISCYSSAAEPAGESRARGAEA